MITTASSSDETYTSRIIKIIHHLRMRSYLRIKRYAGAPQNRPKIRQIRNIERLNIILLPFNPDRRQIRSPDPSTMFDTRRCYFGIITEISIVNNS